MRNKSVVELVVVGGPSLVEAQKRLAACQNCSSGVTRPFRSVLSEVLSMEHPMSEFIMGESVACPNCDSPLEEGTLVRCESDWDFEKQSTIATIPFAEEEVVLVTDSMLNEAAQWITGCQRCCSGAEITFEYILDEVHDSKITAAQYVMGHPVHCPTCGGEVTEKTCVVVTPQP